MVIDNYLIHYKKPSQYLYWGENGLDIYKSADPGKGFKKNKSYPNVSVTDITSPQFREIAREMVSLDTGILFNSGQFIFNVFDFEKIPFQGSTRREVVEWRLKKVFPENLDDYVHDFYKVSKNRILSVLFKKSLKEKVESLFDENNLPLIFIGNTTLEILDYVSRTGSKKIDFFIEIDKSLSIITFLNRGVPFYLRKFRNDQPSGIVNEVIKTVNFVKNSYSHESRTYLLAADPSEIDFHFIKDELLKSEIEPIEMKAKDQLLFSR